MLYCLNLKINEKYLSVIPILIRCIRGKFKFDFKLIQMAIVFSNHFANFVHCGLFPLFCRKTSLPKFGLRKTKKLLCILFINEVYFPKWWFNRCKVKYCYHIKVQPMAIYLVS